MLLPQRIEGKLAFVHVTRIIHHISTVPPLLSFTGHATFAEQGLKLARCVVASGVKQFFTLHIQLYSSFAKASAAVWFRFTIDICRHLATIPWSWQTCSLLQSSR